MSKQDITSLEDIWPLQGALNSRTGFDTIAMGKALEAAKRDGTLEDSDELRTKVGKAIKNYLDALFDECHELHHCLSWKHWYAEAKQGKQYQIQDLQNARVEVIDMLFFWISLCQLLGMAPDDVYRLYEKKLNINHRRQDQGRSQAEHARHEAENKDVV